MFVDICNSLFNRLLASFSTGGHIFSRRNGDLNGLIIRQSSLNSLLSIIKPMCSPFFFFSVYLTQENFKGYPLRHYLLKTNVAF